MSEINNLKASNYLVSMPSAKCEQLAITRERERRERKEKLYSYPSSVKWRNNLP